MRVRDQKTFLRPIEQGDLVQVVEYFQDKEVTDFLKLGLPDQYTLADAQQWYDNVRPAVIQRAIEHYGEFAGMLTLLPLSDEKKHCAEFGYWLGKKFWRQGIMREAAQKFLDFIQSQTTLTRITAEVYQGNLASMNLLHALEFNLEGIHRKQFYKNGEYFDAYLFARLF